MAKKKQSMSFWEAHLEKLLMGVSLVVCILVVAVYWIKPAGVEYKDSVLPASQATKQAADEARRIVEKTKLNDSNPPEPYVPQAPSFINDRSILVVQNTDRILLFPPYPTGHDVLDDPDRIYQVPEILPLKSFSVDFTRAMAYVPQEPAPGTTSTPANPDEIELVLKDIDFVTVEAVYPLAELRQRFQNSFAGDQLPAKQRLERSQPVAAAVELQRSRLLPDGNWGEYEKVARLPVDDLASSEISNETYPDISPAETDVLIAVNQPAHRQMMILQPLPYDLEDGDWLSPTEKKEQEKTAAAEKKAEKKTKRAEGQTGQKTKTVKRKSGSQTPGGGGANPMDLLMKMGMMPGLGLPKGNEKPDRKSANQPVIPGLGREKADMPLDADEITLWAHDDQVKPGGIYRYRIRVGFFNPIAGHNWFSEEQKDLKKQVVLWSDWKNPETLVNVPERILFFPKPGRATAQRSIPVDVFRREDGLWYKQVYNVAPGDIIGKPEKIKTGPKDSEEELAVDYTTHVTVLDIVPEVNYWYKTGKTYRSIATMDIIYRDEEGTIKRLGVDSRSWPEGYKKKQSQLNDILKEQES